MLFFQKPWLHVVAALACLAGSIACAMVAWQRQKTIKRFTADQEVKDLGVLKQHDEREVTFQLLNATASPVEIIRTSTSCTCSQAELSARNLQPGESMDLKVHFRVGSLRGQVAAVVDVMYRKGASLTLERLSLSIKATVEPHYTVTPEEVLIEHESDQAKRTQSKTRIRFAAINQPRLRILSAESTHPAIHVEKIHPGRTDDETVIDLVFDPTRCVTAAIRAELVVRTDSKAEPTHYVPIRAVCRGAQ